MLNILKTDFYKAFTRLSFWIISGIIVIYSLSSSYLYFWMYNSMMAENLTMNPDFGFMNNFYSCALKSLPQTTFYTAIFAIIYAVSDFSQGTIKNIASKGFKREYIYFSKLITILCVAFINIILFFTTSFIMAKILIKNQTEFFKLNNDFIRDFSAFMFQAIAYMSLALLLAMLFRSLGSALGIYFGIISFGSLIIELADQFIYRVLHLDFAIKPYTIAFAFADTSQMLRGSIVILIYIAAITAIGLYTFKKRDIN